jgi:signal transduction histidine kinase
VSVTTASGQLLVRVSDEGVGLDPGWEHSGHYGVRGMRERAVACGGSLEMTSGRGKGTQVLARLPIEPQS